jgi:hypothetical protein
MSQNGPIDRYHDPYGIAQPIPRDWMRPTREEVDDLLRRVERLESVPQLDCHIETPDPSRPYEYETVCRARSPHQALRPEDV